MGYQSATIGELAKALSKAQGEMTNAAKDKDNPFFKSSYADLASIWDACRGPLSKNSLCVTQTLSNLPDGRIGLVTQLSHASGEFITSEIPVEPVKRDPQGWGSAITYARRFTLSAIVGIAPADKDDDDGEAAVGRGHEKNHKFVNSPNSNPIISPVAPRSNPDRSVYLRQIGELMTELGISKEEAQPILERDVGIISLKDASTEQALEFLNILQNEKISRAKEQAAKKPAAQSELAPWEKEMEKM